MMRSTSRRNLIRGRHIPGRRSPFTGTLHQRILPELGLCARVHPDRSCAKPGPLAAAIALRPSSVRGGDECFGGPRPAGLPRTPFATQGAVRSRPARTINGAVAPQRRGRATRAVRQRQRACRFSHSRPGPFPGVAVVAQHAACVVFAHGVTFIAGSEMLVAELREAGGPRGTRPGTPLAAGYGCAPRPQVEAAEYA